MRVADVLREQGVEIAFGVHGGHIWNLVDAMSNAGIKIVTVRHEQAAVYAAEAYSKATGKAGVAFATVGPGVANTLSALSAGFLQLFPRDCALRCRTSGSGTNLHHTALLYHGPDATHH